MIIHSDHSIFGITEKEKIDILVNPANTVGVMGAGLALEFKLRYPEYYAEYHRKALQNQFKIGELYLFQEKDFQIATLFTKKHWKYPSKLEWIKAGFDAINNYLEDKQKLTIAMPLAGAGKGGLSKEEVIFEIERSFKKTPSKVYICHDKISSEHEKTALNKIYKTTPEKISNQALAHIVKIAQEDQKPHRFRDLQKIKGIGKTAYQKLFLAFMKPKKTAKKDEEKGEQKTLFYQ